MVSSIRFDRGQFQQLYQQKDQTSQGSLLRFVLTEMELGLFALPY